MLEKDQSLPPQRELTKEEQADKTSCIEFLNKERHGFAEHTARVNKIADYLLTEGKTDEAAGWLRQTIGCDPKGEHYYTGFLSSSRRLIRIYEHTKNDEGLLKVYQGILDANKYFIDVISSHHKKASALLRLDRHQEALTECKKAVEVYPAFPVSYFFAASIVAAQGKRNNQNYEKAIPLYTKAINLAETGKLDSDQVVPSNKWSGVKKLYRFYGQEFNIDAEAARLTWLMHSYMGRGKCYKYLGDTVSAFKDGKNASRVKKYDSAQEVFKFTILAGESNIFNDPEIIRQQTIEDKNSASELVAQAEILNINGDYTKASEAATYAEQLYRKYIHDKSVHPDLIKTYSLLGDISIKSGSPEKAVGYYTSAISLSENQDVQLYFNRAIANFQSNNQYGAADDFKKIIEIKPDSKDAHYNLGNLYINQGKWKYAVVCLQKAKELGYRESGFKEKLGRAEDMAKQGYHKITDSYSAAIMEDYDPNRDVEMRNLLGSGGNGLSSSSGLGLSSSPPYPGYRS